MQLSLGLWLQVVACCKENHWRGLGFRDRTLDYNMDGMSFNVIFNQLFSRYSKELREGGKILAEKLKKFKPLIAVFNGKCKQLSIIINILKRVISCFV